MKYLLPIALLFISFSAFAQDPKPQAALPAIAEATASNATETITIPKAEYEALKKAAAENQRLIQRRNQLLAENDALAAELALWKQRLLRVLRCQTIQEAIEELRAVLGINQGGGESQVPPAQR